MAAPIRWAVINAPPAVPAWTWGTESSTKSWLGAMTRPFPSPARNSGPTSAQKPGTTSDDAPGHGCLPREGFAADGGEDLA
jgi:hypothetical protein